MLDTSPISTSENSLPPVILRSTFSAPSMLVSRSGLSIAARTASWAAFSPLPTPIPICATPLSFIIVLTSAKSQFIIPLWVITSMIPWTPWRRTSSASLNESLIVTFLSAIFNRRSFGIVTIASTFSARFLIPSSAFLILWGPSKKKGFVTTATVSTPRDFAASAIIGAAPVPVPPPIPAVTNTISVSFTRFLISSFDSSAACLPISGFAPAPKPLVSFLPILSTVGAFTFASCCASVLTQINSAFVTPASIIRSTALLPPPPTPITFILAPSIVVFSSKPIGISLI